MAITNAGPKGLQFWRKACSACYLVFVIGSLPLVSNSFPINYPHEAGSASITNSLSPEKNLKGQYRELNPDDII
ncbi:hypothetical protein V1477_001990 [Vespula maculifrons]|uniref:Uncharacterized protein n=1 Tax=Vespula maculifrons TaxID=7453 RepID=A0ABD2CXP7_VESMC